jgi:hypothetical protein
MFLELKRHIASLGAVERLQVWRAGWVHPVQGKALAVVHDPAREPQNLCADLGDTDKRGERSSRQRADVDSGNEFAASL